MGLGLEIGLGGACLSAGGVAMEQIPGKSKHGQHFTGGDTIKGKLVCLIKARQRGLQRDAVVMRHILAVVEILRIKTRTGLKHR